MTDRYVPFSQRQNPAPGVVSARTTGRGAFETEIAVGPHRLLADEPVSAGGADKGPSPYDLLGAALASCISMTVRMYANRKAWPLDGVRVDVKHDKVRAEDCADCETREGRVDEFRVSLAFYGALDETQRGRLFEIAGKCPVHRTLTSEVNTRFQWADAKG